MPLPLNRLYLAHSLSEPIFGATPEVFYYARSVDGRRHIYRQQRDTGLAQAVTTEPAPSGGLGYGGGLYAVRDDLLVYAARGGKLVGLNLDTGAQWTITPEYEGVAAPAISPCGRFVAFLAEMGQAANVLLVDVRGQALPVKLSEDPWYAFNPAFSPDGRYLAWMEWDPLVMPFDESRLVVARLARPTLECEMAAHALPLRRRMLDRPRTAYASPQFSPDGQFLAYTSDETGWRSLWVTPVEAEDLRQAAERLDTGPGEIGGPDWVPGLIKMRWSDDGQALYAVRRHASQDRLLRVAWPDKSVREVDLDWTVISYLAARGRQLLFIASRSTTPDTLVTLDVMTGAAVPRATSAVGLLDPGSLVEPRVIRWPTAGSQTAWGIHYPAQAPQGEAGPRPLLVYIHGGPTSERTLGWEPLAQYYATRGWHFLFVNHRGGTGYGRAYQDMLAGQWGVVDVEDARTGAEHLVQTGLANPEQLVILGGSAGGYTTLLALTRDPDFWAAGVSLYGGITHLYDAQQGSHRFEINYNASLLGRLPQAGPIWRERSPLTHADKVRVPVLLFHGKEDRVVPYQQSVDFAEAVRGHGGVAEVVLYEDEGHTFSREATKRDVVEKTERFLDKFVINQQR